MNVYLSIAGVGIGSGTAVAGLYGMNVINGLEASPTAFSNIASLTVVTGKWTSMIMCSRMHRMNRPLMMTPMEILNPITIDTGILFSVACVSYISGKTSKVRTFERLREIEVIDGALNKMEALDYTMKCLVDNELSMSQDQFRKKMLESKQFEVINEKEIELLFDALDVSNDGYLNTGDFTFGPDCRRVNMERTTRKRKGSDTRQMK